MILDDIDENKDNDWENYCSYQLIFMDCSMPMMDGYECSSIIRTIHQQEGIKQPIISAITGHTDQQYIDQAVYSGMNMVIKKPVEQGSIGYLLSLINYN